MKQLGTGGARSRETRAEEDINGRHSTGPIGPTRPGSRPSPSDGNSGSAEECSLVDRSSQRPYTRGSANQRR
ncbi:hypothetical protein NDU88_002834 [Pleurodeles waltl]|uniref:Uncharacterized protein n=1 Tax=Pleurodeles waltl TaxID=8319 RepID=A0AAV7KX94_PLEWA|nr:hypothetical protein NDU88_002834 [Pleurodeles waltl]